MDEHNKIDGKQTMMHRNHFSSGLDSIILAVLALPLIADSTLCLARGPQHYLRPFQQ